jgi:hypothetical protein
MSIRYATLAPSGLVLMCHSIVAMSSDTRVYTRRYSARIYVPHNYLTGKGAISVGNDSRFAFRTGYTRGHVRATRTLCPLPVSTMERERKPF